MGDDRPYLTSHKVINDPVHGHIPVPKYCIEFIDTPQFQRLRGLKQLGTTYWVFPGASHNRFEHSLGVSHLAGKLVKKFQKRQKELLISEEDMKFVQLAGLCHDLGHGPFSHAFECWIHRMRPQSEWHHEEMSKKMLEYLIEDNNLEYEKDQIRFLQDLIGGVPTGSSKEKAFLFEIVANTRNSVDVDKFDYLSRDCLNLGIKSSYDHSRLMNFSRVINNEICYHSKEVYNIYEMFHTRYSMHKQVYSHKVGKAIEYMISDAFALADPYLKISEMVDDLELYSTLTDGILQTISSSRSQELAPARNIVKNIHKRNLYKFADDLLINPEKWKVIEKTTEMDIIGKSSGKLKEEDIILNKFTMNYAMKDKNPVDNVHFFTRWDETESFQIPKEDVSLLIPDQFSENFIQIFVRSPEKVRDAQDAFRKFMAGMGCSPNPVHSLPSPEKNTSSISLLPMTKQLPPKKLFDS